MYVSAAGSNMLAISPSHVCTVSTNTLQTIEVHGKHDYTRLEQAPDATGAHWDELGVPVSDPLNVRDTDSVQHAFVRTALSSARAAVPHAIKYRDAAGERHEVLARFYNMQTRAGFWPLLSGSCWKTDEPLQAVTLNPYGTLSIDKCRDNVLYSVHALDVFSSPFSAAPLTSLAQLHYGSTATHRDAMQCLEHQRVSKGAEQRAVRRAGPRGDRDGARSRRSGHADAARAVPKRRHDGNDAGEQCKPGSGRGYQVHADGWRHARQRGRKRRMRRASTPATHCRRHGGVHDMRQCHKFCCTER